MRPRVLFLVPWGVEQPSTRFRVSQYLPYFEDAGVEVVDVVEINGRLSPGELASTFISLLQSLRRSDIVFNHRVPLPAFVSRLLSAKCRVVFDLDDALFVKPFSWSPKKDFAARRRVIDYALGHADAVIAGNDYLADYAKGFSQRVVVIPTGVDTGEDEIDEARFRRWSFTRQVYRPPEGEANRGEVVIGWIGTPNNLCWLDQVGPALRVLQQRHRVQVKVVSGAPWTFPGLEVTNKPWSLAEEVADVQSFDIGLMPLDPDEPFLKGKCGFKIIEYMAVGKPAVASDVGVNASIIRPGYNGYLVSQPDEWLSHLERLVLDAPLRRKMGKEARATVVERYSVRALLPEYLALFRELCQEPGRPAETATLRAH
ncbi:MAG: glycosyltransferase [Calditrichaeota bacterium]|nr:MAG: glycosyltransferase [Calditrichota bacterium]